MGYAVDVPRNADRINKTENQHDPQRDAREKVKHAEEVDAVQNACRHRDDVPACVRKDAGICLQEGVLEYTLSACKSLRKSISWRFSAGAERGHIGQRARQTAVRNS